MKRATLPVSDPDFRQVYDSPASLPGRHQWLTPCGDVREIERLLGIPPNTIGAPLWVSGDRKRCPHCHRETNWLDIVASALGQVHKAEMIAQVILGEQKDVNVEAPRAIAGLKCFRCKSPIDNLRSFKCHNWGLRQACFAESHQPDECVDGCSSITVHYFHEPFPDSIIATVAGEPTW